MKTPTHPSLGERFRNGSEDALAEMYRRYSTSLFSLALHLLDDRDMAAETVQLSFVRAWQAAKVFDVGRELLPWLYSITRRTAVDIWRREARHHGGLTLGENLPMEEPSLDSAWQAWQVRQALDRLPVDERDVVRLAYFEDLTQREIAARLKIPLGTVYSRTARAKRRLAVLLAHVG
ncbi:RNA polymerase sigma factor [Acrocarpospora catenulata]|uniref:RNA polymerase sigma factor n=1 Tax=Acrocarpospora catenulata TaxID=2836182 RepID=UPI001BD9F302|nr:RNA polymerase sigma factor [Acrocarpospora catenulata]